MPRPRGSGPLDAGGRGLHLIEARSTAWGVEATPGGKAVWVLVPV